MSGALDLEGDLAGRPDEPARPTEHRVQVAPEAKRGFRLDGRRHGHLDEVTAYGRTEAGEQADEGGQDDERNEYTHDRGGDGQDGTGDVGGVVAEGVPPGVGVGEEPGGRAVGDALRRRGGGDRGRWQGGFPPVVDRYSAAPATARTHL